MRGFDLFEATMDNTKKKAKCLLRVEGLGYQIEGQTLLSDICFE